jgi:hypothetical protein
MKRNAAIIRRALSRYGAQDVQRAGRLVAPDTVELRDST